MSAGNQEFIREMMRRCGQEADVLRPACRKVWNLRTGPVPGM